MNLHLEDGSHLVRLGAEPCEIPVPAVHPLGQGQMTLRVEISRSVVDRVTATFGDGHRGDEKLLEVRDYRQGLSLINRHNWLTPVAAEIAYARACEELMGLTPPPRALLLRELVLAIQNVTGLAQLLAGNADQTSDWLTQREQLVALTELLTGARLHVSYIRLGGVAHDFSDETLAQAHELLMQVRWPERDFANRWSPAQMVSFNDQRTSLDKHRESALSIINELHAVKGAIDVTLPKVVRVPVGNSYQETDAATGMVGVWLHSDGGKSPLRVALRAPSLLSISRWEQDSIGLPFAEAIGNLLALPLCYGEIER